MKRLVLAVTFLSSIALADSPLIKEVEALRNSLPAKDPGRATLSLRLADLLFDEVGSISKVNTLTKEEERTIANYRTRAVRLYEEALAANPAATLTHKIRFQLARIYSDMGQEAKAEALWKALMAQEDFTDLRREAALRLAEKAEKRDAKSTEAEKYYRLALSLCSGTDVCSYSHYRLGWLNYQRKDSPKAISEMELALWDSKGQIREEALRDYLLFLSTSGGDGQVALDKIELLSQKLNRPTLVKELAESFFAAGNKLAGTKVLAVTNARAPELTATIRLLEEYYGLRQWEAFRETLVRVEQMMAVPATETPGPESEKLLRRLSVQLDGERTTKKEHNPDFKAVCDLYLKLYPTSRERFKVVEGWLAAEQDPQLRLDQLKRWLTDEKLNLTREERIKLHEFRAASAQKAKAHDIIATEMESLIAMTPTGAQVREYRFHRAVALKEMNQKEEAMRLLTQLATLSGPPDPWASQAQRLLIQTAMDAKDYSAIISHSKAWLESPHFGTAKTLTKALTDYRAEMKSIQEQAFFEQAAAMGETPQALLAFKEFCSTGRFVPKSCENARVLAIRLKDQEALIAILKIQDKKQELLNEYEAAGHFKEAAALQESLTGTKATPAEILRTSMLYELGGDLVERDRLLLKLKSQFQKTRKMGELEPAFFQTAKEAKLMDASWFSLPWSAANRNQLAGELEAKGQGNKETYKLVLNSKIPLGSAWSNIVMAELKRLDDIQAKIDFYGRNSSRKFESRLAALKKLVATAESYLPSADAETRMKILQLLKESHSQLAQTILNSPLPGELTEEQKVEVTASLKQMAGPFEEKAGAYTKLQDEQKVAQAANEQKRAEVAAATVAAPTVTADQIRQAVSVLNKDPGSKMALEEIKRLYESQGQFRLASYFEGRLRDLSNEGKAQ